VWAAEAKKRDSKNVTDGREDDFQWADNREDMETEDSKDVDQKAAPRITAVKMNKHISRSHKYADKIMVNETLQWPADFETLINGNKAVMV
jgi:hypothetical protein